MYSFLKIENLFLKNILSFNSYTPILISIPYNSYTLFFLQSNFVQHQSLEKLRKPNVKSDRSQWSNEHRGIKMTSAHKIVRTCPFDFLLGSKCDLSRTTINSECVPMTYERVWVLKPSWLLRPEHTKRNNWDEIGMFGNKYWCPCLFCMELFASFSQFKGY